MTFEDLLTIIGTEPVFDTGLLLVGDVKPGYLRRQLSEWVKSGKLWQLRRGLYTLAPPYQKVALHPFYAANRLVVGSYISLQAALGYHGLIPEQVTAVTSVTIRRPGEWKNQVGHFLYRHIHPNMFFGYQRLEVKQHQYVFVATPEKAVLDLVYLQPEGDSPDYLASLRLQNLDQLDAAKLRQFAARTDKPKLLRSARHITQMISAEAEAYETL